MRLQRAHRLALARVHADVASQLIKTLSQALGEQVYVGLVGQRLCRFGDFIEPLTDPSCIFNFSMWSTTAEGRRDQQLGWGVFDLAMPIARILLGEDSTAPRPFTNADMKILRPTIRSIIGALQTAWSVDDRGVAIGDIQLKNSPQNISVIASETPSATVDMEIDFGSRADPLYFCYPATLIETLVDK